MELSPRSPADKKTVPLIGIVQLMHSSVLHLNPSNLALMVVIDAGLSCSSVFSSPHFGSIA